VGAPLIGAGVTRRICFHVDAAECGRLPGVAGAGLLQVRAAALIPCGDGLRPPCASLTQGLRPSDFVLTLH
jgi:hypothetical protein